MLPDDLTEPQPRAAYAYWCSKRGMRAMPAPGDIDPVEIPRLLPFVTLIQVLPGEPADYLYRIEGEALRMAFGLNRRGKRLSALEGVLGAAHAGFRARLEQVRLGAAPLAHTSLLVSMGFRFFSLQSVLLPLSQDGAQVDRIFACTGFVARPDVIAEIETDPAGHPVARPAQCRRA
jgi:hypothetical protein